VHSSVKGWVAPNQFQREETMTSAQSIITVIGASAFGLIVIAIVVRVFGEKPVS